MISPKLPKTLVACLSFFLGLLEALGRSGPAKKICLLFSVTYLEHVPVRSVATPRHHGARLRWDAALQSSFFRNVFIEGFIRIAVVIRY